jgi:hypothetical protein
LVDSGIRHTTIKRYSVSADEVPGKVKVATTAAVVVKIAVN